MINSEGSDDTLNARFFKKNRHKKSFQKKKMTPLQNPFLENKAGKKWFNEGFILAVFYWKKRSPAAGV